MLLVGRPVARSMRCTGGRLDPSQLFAPHRSIAQISLRGPISTPAVEPHVRLSGNTPQLRTAARYGFGRSCPEDTGACVRTDVPEQPTRTTAERVPQPMLTADFLRCFYSAGCSKPRQNALNAV